MALDSYQNLTRITDNGSLIFTIRNFEKGNQSIDWYVAHMPPSFDHQMTIDLSTSSIHNKTALNRLKSFNETVRVILVICDPIDRLVNNHVDHLKRETHPRESFDERRQVESLIHKVFPVKNDTPTLNTDMLSGIGDYFKYLIDLYQAFPRRQVHVLEQRRFYDNPAQEMSKLHKFLRVSPFSESMDIIFDRPNNKLCYNCSISKRVCVKEPLRNTTKLFLPKYGDHLARLRKFFAFFNKRLFIYLENVYEWL
ncbi:hypothetical protein Btru_042576 [Bulinus truncatus]|nr:hypothetical protein Btru_042576 [Bulinus truncatus]